MEFDPKHLDRSTLLRFYRELMKPRLIEEKMLILLRQGRISKWFSGYGQEAISVGTTLAMEPNEFMLPMHRNLGVFTARQIRLAQLFKQFQGKAGGFTKGRDRSFHFGSKEHHLVGMISHLGPQLGVADGIALGNKLAQNGKATLVFTGDGGASEGDFHEALNTAAVWQLPVLFVVENNCWGLSTPSNEQFRFESFTQKAAGYGMEMFQVNGNNLLEVYHKVKELTDRMRKDPQPFLLECMTFRMRGHEEASGTKYYPEGLQDKWSKQDPVTNFEQWMLDSGNLSDQEKQSIVAELKEEIQSGLEEAFAEEPVTFSAERELGDLFAPHHPVITAPAGEQKEMRLIDAVQDALRTAMRQHPNLVIMGQDIAEYGGVFKVTEGFVEEFGKGRVRNTPLCESAIVGAALGLSINGHKAVMEMQFADFVTEGFTQIVNNLAKIHYRWGQNADVVIRMPTGAGVAAGPFHSQSNEAWFTHTAGLKVVYPAFAEDAKGLLLAAINDPNPVMFFEHKALYRSISSLVPAEAYEIPIGKARLVKEGKAVSIITYGMGVHWALDLMEKHPEVDAELVDLRTLSPLDWETVLGSAERTGRVLVLHEDVRTGSLGADLAATIQERCFNYLDAPVMRVTSMDLPVPFAPTLEQGYLANAYLEEAFLKLMSY